MTREDIERRVKQIVSEQTGINADAFTLESGFTADLGCDSLDDIEIVMLVENRFAIEIPDDDADKCVTVKDACDLVERLLVEQAA
jgi:acyl carrier protein